MPSYGSTVRAYVCVCASRKLYDRHDLVTPICDMMSLLHSSIYSFGIGGLAHKERRQSLSCRISRVSFSTTTLHLFDTQRTGLSSTRPFARVVKPSVLKTSGRTGVICKGCNTTDERKVTLNSQGFRVCDCGVEAGYAEFGMDYKEVHGTENGAPRAEVPRESLSSSSRLTKNLHSLRHMPTGTLVPESVRKAGRLGRAPEAASAAAAKDGPEMTKGQARKLTNVIDAVNRVSTQIGPVDECIMRKVRTTADRLYCKSIEHAAFCDRRGCHLTLFDKPVRVIACKAFAYTIEKASKGEGIGGVTKHSLTALQSKIDNSHVFNTQDNAAQNTSCTGMLAALDSEQADQACRTQQEPEKHFKRKSAPEESLAGRAVKRQNSDLSSSPICQVRDAISRMGLFFGPAVRDAAIGALTDANVLKAVKSHEVVPCSVGKCTTAYVLLQSVALNRGEKHDVSQTAARVGVQSCGLQEMVQKMRSLLPASTSGGMMAEEDGLY